MESVAESWGPPAPSHAPLLRHPSTGFRAWVSSIWRAWLLGEELDQAGEGDIKEPGFHGWRRERRQSKTKFWGLKTRDSGAGRVWKTAPAPSPGLALTSHRQQRRKIVRASLKPHPTSFLSPEAQTRAPPHTSPLKLFLLVSARAPSPTAPPSVPPHS